MILCWAYSWNLCSKFGHSFAFNLPFKSNFNKFLRQLVIINFISILRYSLKQDRCSRSPTIKFPLYSNHSFQVLRNIISRSKLSVPNSHLFCPTFCYYPRVRTATWKLQSPAASCLKKAGSCGRFRDRTSKNQKNTSIIRRERV